MKVSKKVTQQLKTKVAKQVKEPSFTREAHTIKSVFAAAAATGVDVLRSWKGTEIKDKLVNTLIGNAEKLTSTRLAKTPGKVLVIQGAKAHAIPVLAQSGDIYEVPVDVRPDDAFSNSYKAVAKQHRTLRGSLSALREAYGNTKVSILNKDAALKLLKSFKVDKQSLAQVTG